MFRKINFFYPLCLLLCCMTTALSLSSCSEESGTVEEYPGWQVKNEAFYNQLTDSVVALLQADPGRTDWKRIKCWSKPDTLVGGNDYYVIVHVLESGPATETQMPLFTDTVSVHYCGRLLPSVSYPQGKVFDRTYVEPFDAEVSSPSKFAVGSSSESSGLVAGFSSVLQHMHRGDHWVVYIPYQLAYGTTEQSGIPAYSTLIFDLRLVDFWSPRVSE